MLGSVWIGVAVGIATGLWMWGEYALGLHTTHAEVGRFTGFLSIVFPIAGLILALRRARLLHGALNFRAGMPHILVVSAAAALALEAMSAVYVVWINPHWLVRTGQSATAFILQGAAAALIGGIVLGLILLAFMRTRRREIATS